PRSAGSRRRQPDCRPEAALRIEARHGRFLRPARRRSLFHENTGTGFLLARSVPQARVKTNGGGTPGGKEFRRPAELAGGAGPPRPQMPEITGFLLARSLLRQGHERVSDNHTPSTRPDLWQRQYGERRLCRSEEHT